MVNKQLLLVLLVSSTLVACSSSKSSDDSSSSGGNGGSTNTNKSKKIITLSSDSKTGTSRSSITSSDTTETDVNKIKIGNKTITLMPSGMSSNAGFLNLMGVATGVNGDNSPRIVSGTAYQSKFGLVKNGDKIIAFSQGEATKESAVPTTGTAKYNGIYAGYNHGNSKTGTGKFTGTVDFANKKINISVGADNTGYAGSNIDAKITGNSFSGDNKKSMTKGQFYGDKAEEVSGVHNENGYTAAFGGKK